MTLKEISASLLRSMSESLGLEPEYLTNVFEDQTQMIRFNYYPPCPKANKVISLSSHSDATGLTSLLQANNVSGLRVKKNGKWLTVEPLLGAFIVNVGDLLEIFTNGRYKSMEHRAMINSKNAGISLAAFNAPAHDIMGPLTELLKGGEELYMTTSREEYMKGYFAAKLKEKTYLERVKISK